MFYITGDTHGDPSHLAMHKFPAGENDTIIICGDFGFIWTGKSEDNYWLNWLAKKPFATLFVDGNHENFSALNSYPIKEYRGGYVHKIRDNVFHLIRGNVFDLDGKKVFVMGGGTSTDKTFRKENITWWKEEEINYEEISCALTNLSKYDCHVDIVITHELPNNIIKREWDYGDEYNTTRRVLQGLHDIMTFDIWYCGHYHRNISIDNKYQILYDAIIPFGTII